jgi:hypothetical protein
VGNFLLRATRVGNTLYRHYSSKAGHCAQITIRVCACLVMMIAFCAVAHSQTATGQFNGHVFDQNGAVVPGAKITLLDVQTNLSRSTQTNGEGLYEFPLLPPGNYKITAAESGFQEAVSPELKLDVNQTSSQDFHLQVGAASQTVNVSASSAELLQASSSELGAVIEQRSVNELPLNGRNFTALLTLAPGVNTVNYSQNNTLNAAAAPPGIPGSTFVFPSIQGQWNRESLYFQDGLSNTAVNRSSYDVPPIVDAVQEFKIQSHNDVAEFGGVLGGVVNIVTKSGTNSYHGAAWEYLRNNAFDSRNPFTDFHGNTPAPPAAFRQNEFGADVGGPVRIPKLYNGMNKTFFYFAWESWRYSKAAGLSYVSPTAAELAGDFTNASIVNNQNVSALLYNPFQTSGTPGHYTRPLLGGDGHHIPANMIDAGNQTFLKTYSDTPNFTPSTPGGPNTILNSVGVNNANQYNGRIDQNFGANNTIFFRYSLISVDISNPQSFHLTSLTTTTNRNFGGGYTHVFSPNIILDGRVGRSGRFGATSGGVPLGGVARQGFPAIEPNYGNVTFAYTSSSAVGQSGLASGYNNVADAGPTSVGGSQADTNYAANITWLHGNHQIRFGFEQLIFGQQTGPLSKNYGTGTFNFATPETADPQNAGSTGNPLAGALLGVPDNGRFNRPSFSATRFEASGAYIQDSWKVTPRLTINAGLRWDGQSSPHLLNGTTAGMLDPNTGNWIVSGGKLPPPCNPVSGVYAPCIPSADPATNAILAAHVVPAANPNLGPDPVYTSFGPRFGVAFKLDPSTVIRGGYGLIYDTTQGSVQTVNDRLNAWPSNFSLPLVFNVIGQPVDTMTQITPTLANAKALPAVTTPFQQFGWYYDPHMKTAYSHQFNVDIQRQVSTSLVASISYVGSINRRLQLTGLDNNSPVPGEAGANRPFPWSGTALEATARGTSNYNAMQVRVDKRMSSGLAFGTGYTWSKSMDNGGSGFYGVENGPQSYSTMQNYNNLSADYGISGNSITNIVYGWGLYELPLGKDKPYLNHGFVSYVVGGWQANTNLSAHSGPPLGFPDAGRDPANIGNTGTYNYDRANLIGNPKVSHPTKNMAFNTAAFAHPVNAYGNSGRGIVHGMPYDNIDFSLMKQLPITERAALQFRAEFFNLFNIQNYGLPNTTFGGSGFGVITNLTAGATPRQIQFSLRASF